MPALHSRSTIGRRIKSKLGGRRRVDAGLATIGIVRIEVIGPVTKKPGQYRASSYVLNRPISRSIKESDTHGLVDELTILNHATPASLEFHSRIVVVKADILYKMTKVHVRARRKIVDRYTASTKSNDFAIFNSYISVVI
jgi:hypothetical protein